MNNLVYNQFDKYLRKFLARNDIHELQSVEVRRSVLKKLLREMVSLDVHSRYKEISKLQELARILLEEDLT